MFIRITHVAFYPYQSADAKDVAPSAYFRYGAFVKALPWTRVVKTCREPLARFHSHPASFTRPPRRPSSVSRLVRGSPSIYQPRRLSSRPASEEVFQFFVRRLSCNAFNLLDLGAWVKGRYSEFRPDRPAAVRSGDSPKGYQPVRAASTPDREVLETEISGCVREGALIIVRS